MYNYELTGEKGGNRSKCEKYLRKAIKTHFIKDNPAGQGNECTPIILIHEKDSE